MSEYKCNRCSKVVRSKGFPPRWVSQYEDKSGDSKKINLCSKCKLEAVLENWRTA